MSSSNLASGIEVIDRLRAHTFFGKPTGSISGILGTLAFIALALYMFIPIADKIIKGDYYEYSLERHKVPDTTIESP